MNENNVKVDDRKEYWRISTYRKEYWRKYYREHREERIAKAIEWRKNHPKRNALYSFIFYHPKLYPLDDKCAFCGRTKKLEHGHLDYEDEGHNYLTVCHSCNMWMRVEGPSHGM